MKTRRYLLCFKKAMCLLSVGIYTPSVVCSVIFTSSDTAELVVATGCSLAAAPVDITVNKGQTSSRDFCQSLTWCCQTHTGTSVVHYLF